MKDIEIEKQFDEWFEAIWNNFGSDDILPLKTGIKKVCFGGYIKGLKEGYSCSYDINLDAVVSRFLKDK